MNIDVRNIDKDWVDAIEFIQQNNFEINTTAKAVRYSSLQYSILQSKITDLEKQIENLNGLIEEHKDDKVLVKDYFNTQKELMKIFT